MEATRPFCRLALWPVAAVAIIGILVLISRWTGLLLPIGLGLGLSWVGMRYFRKPPPARWLALAIPAFFHFAAVAFLANLFRNRRTAGSWPTWLAGSQASA
jgi:hypothetical protein